MLPELRPTDKLQRLASYLEDKIAAVRDGVRRAQSTAESKSTITSVLDGDALPPTAGRRPDDRVTVVSDDGSRTLTQYRLAVAEDGSTVWEPEILDGHVVDLTTVDMPDTWTVDFDQVSEEIRDAIEDADTAARNAQEVAAQAQSAAAASFTNAKMYVQSRGTNLVTNGTGLLGDATNFPGAEFVREDAPTGVQGSFRYGTGTQLARRLDELIPVDPSKVYELSYWARQVVGSGRFYSGFAPVDAYGLSILPYFYMEVAGTRTTLAQPLNPGDTEVVLTDASGWNDTNPTSGQTGFIFWDYVDPGGKLWEPGTYSRHRSVGRWNAGAINGSVVTLNAPWPASLGAHAAGTPVSQPSSGGSYMYVGAASTPGPAEWTQFSGRTERGVIENPTSTSAQYKFPAATAAVQVIFLFNYSASADSRQAVAGVSLTEVTAGQAAEDAADAAAELAGSKADILIQDTEPTAAMRKSTTLWIDTTEIGDPPAPGNVAKAWDGSAWVVHQDKGVQDAAADAAQAKDLADAAVEAATQAQTTANGKNRAGYGPAIAEGLTPPITGTEVDGDLYFGRGPSFATTQLWRFEGGTWYSDPIDGAVLANLDAGTITTGFLDVANRIAAGAITTPKLAAEAITGEKIAGDAIDGKTITGATVRTASAGQRVQLDIEGLRAFDTTGTETARLEAGTGGLQLDGTLEVEGEIVIPGAELDMIMGDGVVEVVDKATGVVEAFFGAQAGGAAVGIGGRNVVLNSVDEDGVNASIALLYNPTTAVEVASPSGKNINFRTTGAMNILSGAGDWPLLRSKMQASFQRINQTRTTATSTALLTLTDLSQGITIERTDEVWVVTLTIDFECAAASGNVAGVVKLFVDDEAGEQTSQAIYRASTGSRGTVLQTYRLAGLPVGVHYLFVGLQNSGTGAQYRVYESHTTITGYRVG